MTATGGINAASTSGWLSFGFTAARETLVTVPMLPVVLIVFVYFAITVDGFATAANMTNMARQFAPLLIAAIGATLVFLIGGIDLSVGAVMSLASVVGALVMVETESVTLGLIAGLASGALVGCANGLAVSRLRLTPFVHTLGVLLTVRAVAFLISGGHPIGSLPREARQLGRMAILGTPLIFWISLLIFVIAWLALSRTAFGREIYLVGANRRAALFNGLRVRAVEVWVYCIASILAAAAGMLALMRLGSGSPVLGDNLLLQVIAAVVIGGTSILGGSGGVLRTITGVALITILDKGLNLQGLAFYDQAIAIGLVIVAGSGFGTWLERRRIGQAQARLDQASADPGEATRPMPLQREQEQMSGTAPAQARPSA